MIFKLNKNILLAFFLLVCGIAFFSHDIYYIQGGDDVFYKFKLDNPKMDMNPQLLAYPHQKIETWSDIIESQNIHYVVHSGRYLVHVFVQACTSFLSRTEFVTINSIVFCLMLLGFGIMINKQNVLKGSFLGLMSMILVGTDVFRVIFGQIAFAVNYMWCMTAMLFWLIAYEKVIGSTSDKYKKYSLLLFIFSIFVASLHEGFSVGFGAGVFINTLFRIKKITTTEASMLIGFVIGASICVFSPGNVGKDSLPTFFNGASHLLHDLKTYWPLYFGLVTLLIHLVLSRKQTLEFCKANIIYITVVVVEIVFAFVIAYTHDRQLLPATFSLMLISLRLWQTTIVRIPSKVKYAMCGLATIYTIIIFFMALQLRKTVYEGHKYVMDQLLNTNNRVLVADKFYDAIAKNYASWVGRTYVCTDGLDYFHAFSILKTDDKDPEYLQAIVPVSLDKMEKECRANHDEFGMTKFNGAMVVCSDIDVNPSDFKWKFKRIQYNPNHIWEQSVGATYKVAYKNKFYYIFSPMTIIETISIGTEKDLA